MKKYSKLMAVLLVVAMLLPGIAQAAPAVTKEDVHYVTVIDLNLRTRNDDTASPVVFVPEGEKVLFTGEKTDNGYFSLEYNGKEGYAHRGDVTSEENYNSNDKTIHDIKLNEKSNGKSYRVVQNISLRTGNGKQYRSVELMVRDGVVKHLGTTENGWFKVNYDGQDGYVYRGDVTGLDNSGSDEIHDIELVEKANNKTYVAIVDLALRTGNGKQYKAIGLVERGQEVTHLGATANGWFKVDANGTVGYVYRGDLTSRANYDDLHEELKVKSVVVVDEVTLKVELTDGTVHTVTLKTALKDNVKTEVTFEIDGNEYTATVTYVAKGLKVESVSAINGTLTVVFNETPDSVPAVTDFKVIQNINGVTKAINASSVQWDAATKTAKLAVPTIYATEVDQNVSYSVGYKETAAKISASFQVAKVTEAKVDSVTALNSKQIQLVFNQEMDKDSVEDVTKYLFVAAPQGKAISAYQTALTAAAGSTAELQDDKKTVIITLGNTEALVTDVFKANGILENKTSIGVALKATTVKSVSGKVLEKDAIFAIKLDDTTAPTVSKVEVNELGGLEVTFNEQVDGTKGHITVNGFTYDMVTAAAAGKALVTHDKGVSTATISKAELTDATKAKLVLGKSYTIAVSKQEDVYGKTATAVFSSSFTYAVNAVAPVLKSVTAVDEKSFILEFNKDVTDVATPGTALTVQVNKGAFQLATITTSDIFAGRKEGQYKVTLAGNDVNLDVLYDRAKNETSTNLTVYIPAIKDAAGNITAAGNTSVTLSKDVTKPAVEKAVSTGTQLDVTLTETINAITAANLATGSYVLAENGRQIPTLAAGFGPTAPSFVTGDLSAGDDSFIFDYTAGVAVATPLTEGNYTLVIKKDTLTDQSLNNGNKNDEIRIPFAVGAGLQVKPEVTGTVNAIATAGEIVVDFSSPVTYQSVANYKNYKIDGITIPGASTFTLDAAGTKLTIKLPEATYKETKDRVVSIIGARNLAGTVMEEYQAVTKVSENEEIKLQSAKVVGEDIILTFNENVDATTLTGGSAKTFVGNDFIVKVNGTTVATIANPLDNANDTKTPKVEKNQLRVAAPADVNFATGTITVEVIENALAKDVAGNKATAVIVPVTR